MPEAAAEAAAVVTVVVVVSAVVASTAEAEGFMAVALAERGRHSAGALDLPLARAQALGGRRMCANQVAWQTPRCVHQR